MEHETPFGNSNQENGPTFLDFPLFLGIFQWDEPTKRVPFTAELEIPEIWTKWKAPTVTIPGNSVNINIEEGGPSRGLCVLLFSTLYIVRIYK